MNETLSETKKENAAAPFAREIVDTSMDVNNLLATGKVKFLVRTHYVDTANDIAGIEQLICSILKTTGAVFPKGAEQSELRNVVIAGSMFFSEIEAKVREAFGADRYPPVTLRIYLARKCKKIGTVQLTGKEDANRTSPKPRAKYFLTE